MNFNPFKGWRSFKSLKDDARDAAEEISGIASGKGAALAKKLAFGGLTAAVVIPVAYIIVGELSGRVNNTDLPLNTPSGGSQIIETMARSMDRELKTNYWCPSGSPASPTHIRFDVCAFQEGVQLVTIRVAQDVFNHFTRDGGPSSKTDDDMYAALNGLNRGNRWSFWRSNATASQYEGAVVSLDRFNQRLAAKEAAVYPRINNLSDTTNSIASVLGGETAHLRDKAATDGTFSFEARADFFHALGVLAAGCWYLKAMNVDFADVIKFQSAVQTFDQAAKSTCAALDVNPYSVINGSGYGLAPGHIRTLYGVLSNATNDVWYAHSSVAAAPNPPR